MDQLAIIASGRPIFGQMPQPAAATPEETEDAPMTGEEAEAMAMRAARRRPGRLVSIANRIMRREQENRYPRVLPTEEAIQAVMNDLDQAEAKGRQA